MDCLFCKIAAGEIGSEVIYEDTEVKVFKDLHPKAPVHLLVIPKTHIQSIAHLDPAPFVDCASRGDSHLVHKRCGVEADQQCYIIAKLIYAAKNAAADQGLKGYKLVFNVGREGGQVIDHLHLHLLGGWGSEGERSINV